MSYPVACCGVFDLKLFNLANSGSERDFDLLIPKGNILKTPQERVALVKEQLGLDFKIEDYTDFIPAAYSEHAREILASNPDYVVCPIGSGKLWKTIVDVIEEQGLPTRVIGIAPRKGNPFYRPNQFESSGADKLTAPYTALRTEVLSRAPKHTVVEVSERQLKKAYKEARRQGVECEVSGAAAFVFYDTNFKERNNFSFGQNVVLVSTGRGMAETIQNLGRKQSFRKLSALSTLTSMVLGFFLLVAGYVHQNGKLLGDFVHNLAQSDYGRLALEYVLEGRVDISQLNDEDIATASIILGMGSDGLDNIVYSNVPKIKARYEDYAVRCKLHQGCKFKP